MIVITSNNIYNSIFLIFIFLAEILETIRANKFTEPSPIQVFEIQPHRHRLYKFRFFAINVINIISQYFLFNFLFSHKHGQFSCLV